MADELYDSEALRGHINCGGVKLNLDKLTFSLSCIYCDLEMMSIKEFGYHFQEHLVMSKAENEILLRNVEENFKNNNIIITKVEQIIPPPPAPQTTTIKVQEAETETELEKQTDYEIEMLDDTTEEADADNIEIPTNIENNGETQFVYEMIDNEMITEFDNTTTTAQAPPSNSLEEAQEDAEEDEQHETVDIGFDVVPDDETAIAFFNKQIDGLTCDVCEFKFTDAATLRKHRQHHHRCHRCDICKTSFTSKLKLMQHLRTHKNKLIYDCGDCNQSFSTSSELAIHQFIHQRIRERRNVIHEREKLHVCSTCGKSFQDERTLRQHIKVHTSARPFVCIECNMTFSKSHALMLHTKLHSDVRKFSCSICRMTFAQKSGLMNHLRDRHSMQSNTITAGDDVNEA